MKECVTHHYACDCREREFERTKQELEAARAELKRTVHQWQEMSIETGKQLADAKAQIADYEGALEFYSSGSWHRIQTPKFVLDKGDIAREALNKWRAK